MKQFQHIGVFLNDEPGDDEALAFADRFAQLAEASSVVCILVHGMEQELGLELPEQAPLEQRVLSQLSGPVAERTRVEVHSNKGVAEILRSAMDESLDLIVVGRRLPHTQQAAGSAFVRLVRKSPCSVLVVPERTRVHFARIQVLVDGSEHSRMALDTALRIARASKERSIQIIAHAVYEINFGYRYTGETFHEARTHREDVLREKMKPFLAGIDTDGVEFDVVYSCSHDLASAAYDLASARHLDMIVMGSRGRTKLAAALVGCMTEAVVRNASLPVFVVKKKGETMHFLEALLTG